MGESVALQQVWEMGLMHETGLKWWYDLDYGSPTWTLASTVRKMTLAVDGIVEES